MCHTCRGFRSRTEQANDSLGSLEESNGVDASVCDGNVRERLQTVSSCAIHGNRNVTMPLRSRDRGPLVGMEVDGREELLAGGGIGRDPSIMQALISARGILSNLISRVLGRLRLAVSTPSCFQVVMSANGAQALARTLLRPDRPTCPTRTRLGYLRASTRSSSGTMYTNSSATSWPDNAIGSVCACVPLCMDMLAEFALPR